MTNEQVIKVMELDDERAKEKIEIKKQIQSIRQFLDTIENKVETKEPINEKELLLTKAKDLDSHLSAYIDYDYKIKNWYKHFKNTTLEIREQERVESNEHK